MYWKKHGEPTDTKCMEYHQSEDSPFHLDYEPTVSHVRDVYIKHVWGIWGRMDHTLSCNLPDVRLLLGGQCPFSPLFNNFMKAFL